MENTQEQKTPETLKPEQMELGKWYVIETNFRYLAQFDKIEDNAVVVSKYYYYGDGGKIKSYARLCNTEVIKSIQVATKDEVLKYFTDEVFEPIELRPEEPADWKGMYHELKAKYDQLEPKGEKVYFYMDDNIGIKCGYLQTALDNSKNNNPIYEAYCIGKKKSVLVNENS